MPTMQYRKVLESGVDTFSELDLSEVLVPELKNLMSVMEPYFFTSVPNTNYIVIDLQAIDGYFRSKPAFFGSIRYYKTKLCGIYNMLKKDHPEVYIMVECSDMSVYSRAMPLRFSAKKEVFDGLYDFTKSLPEGLHGYEFLIRIATPEMIKAFYANVDTVVSLRTSESIIDKYVPTRKISPCYAEYFLLAPSSIAAQLKDLARVPIHFGEMKERILKLAKNGPFLVKFLDHFNRVEDVKGIMYYRSRTHVDDFFQFMLFLAAENRTSRDLIVALSYYLRVTRDGKFNIINYDDKWDLKTVKRFLREDLTTELLRKAIEDMYQEWGLLGTHTVPNITIEEYIRTSEVIFMVAGLDDTSFTMYLDRLNMNNMSPFKVDTSYRFHI